MTTYTDNPTSTDIAAHLEAGGAVEYRGFGDWRPTIRLAADFIERPTYTPHYRLVHDDAPPPAAPQPYVPADGAIICLARDVSDGWETRGNAEDDWGTEGEFVHADIVEARPKPAPPVTVELPRHVAASYVSRARSSSDMTAVCTAIRSALEAAS